MFDGSNAIVTLTLPQGQNFGTNTNLYETKWKDASGTTYDTTANMITGNASLTGTGGMTYTAFKDAGVVDGITWSIDADYNLVIRPNASATTPGDWSGSKPWSSYKANIKTITFNSGIKMTGKSLFQAFESYTSLTSADFSKLDTSNVTDMNYMFSNCNKLTNLNLSNFNTSSVTNMGYMFNCCRKLTSLDLSSFNTENVTNMECMFTSCNSLTELDLSGFNTKKVTNMYSMFGQCTVLASLNISSFDMSAVTNKSYMFVNAGNITYLTLLKGQDFSGTLLSDSAWKDETKTSFATTADMLANNVSRTSTGAMTYTTDIAWGESGDCSWVIHKNGQLVITPKSEAENILSDWGDAPEWKDYSSYIKSVDIKGKVVAQTCKSMFDSCSNNLISIDLTNLDTSNAKDMSRMFYGCLGLTSLDVSGLNTSNVTDMSYMFYKAYKLASLDVSNFDTSNVTDMSYMFAGGTDNYIYMQLATITFGEYWNTSKVVNMSHMFDGCSMLGSLDVTRFNTSSVTNMSGMFSGCRSLALDKPNFDTSNVTDMSNMFYQCYSLLTFDISALDTSKVKNMSGMFKACTYLTSLDVSKIDTSGVTNMSSMFSDCYALESLDVSNFNTANVTDMSNMFYECFKLKSLDVKKWNTSNVTNMASLFEDCSGLESLDLSNFNTSNVTDMSSMFSMLYSGVSGISPKLTSLDLSNFDTSNVTDMSLMFTYCTSLTSLDVTKFETSKVGNMYGMFAYCTGLTSLDMSKFDTSQVKNMSTMFGLCTSLTSLDVSNFNTANVTDMSCLFYGCTALTTLDISGFDVTTSTTDKSDMFTDSSAITSLSLPQGQNFADTNLLESKWYDENNDDYADTATMLANNVSRTSSGAMTYTTKPTIVKATVDGIPDQATYTGSEITPVPTVTLDGTVLTKDTDYTVSYKDNKNAGTATVIITGTGAYAGTIEKTFTITAKQLTVTGTTVASKTYDGTTTASATCGTLTGVIGSDEVNVAVDSAEFASANVGTSVDATVKYTLSGANASNYSVADETITAAITAKQLMVTGTSVADKVYDGTTDATASLGTVEGIVSGDDTTVTISSADFADANAGNDKNVTVKYGLSGTAASNYIVPVNDTVQASITTKQLTVTGTTVASKTYDGTTTATATCGTLTGVIGSDDVNVSVDSATFASVNVGASIDVTVKYALTGGSAANYSVADETLAAAITAKQLTVTGTTVASKTYDGTTTASATLGTVSGVVSGDDATVAVSSAKFADANAGDDKNVTVKYELSGDKAANYVVPVDDVIKASITAKSVASATVGDIAPQTYTGSVLNPDVSVTLDGKALTKGVDYTLTYSQDSPTLLSNLSNLLTAGTSSTLASIQPKNAGTYTVTVNGIGNYTDIATKTQTFTIDKADTTFDINAATGLVYTGSDQTLCVPELTGTSKPTAGHFEYATSATGTWSTTVPLGSAAGDYPVYVRYVSEDANFNDGAEQSATVTISQVSIADATVSDIANQSYTGSEITPEPTVTLNGTTLVKGTDYTLTYKDNINPGTATITITGTGNYKDTVTKTFTITKKTDNTNTNSGGTTSITGTSSKSSSGSSSSGTTLPQTGDTGAAALAGAAGTGAIAATIALLRNRRKPRGKHARQ